MAPPIPSLTAKTKSAFPVDASPIFSEIMHLPRIELQGQERILVVAPHLASVRVARPAQTENRGRARSVVHRPMVRSRAGSSQTRNRSDKSAHRIAGKSRCAPRRRRAALRRAEVSAKILLGARFVQMFDPAAAVRGDDPELATGIDFEQPRHRKCSRVLRDGEAPAPRWQSAPPPWVRGRSSAPDRHSRSGPWLVEYPSRRACTRTACPARADRQVRKRRKLARAKPRGQRKPPALRFRLPKIWHPIC